MRATAPDPWTHEHVFLGRGHDANEKRTWVVVALTSAMMVGEILAGSVYNSMALLADGWHMATHAGALGISALAYRYARSHARDPRFTFGTGKVGDLAGYTSAVVLGVVAILIGWEAAQRLRAPVAIAFDEAMAVAALGLLVNVASAAILARGGGHSHGHHDHHHDGGRDLDHDHDLEREHDVDHDHREHGHADHNLRAAYLHVLADALTSVLALAALALGRFVGATWLDPAMGLVGAAVIARWSVLLARDTGRVLVDVAPEGSVAAAIRGAVEARGGERVSDLHLWRVGPGHVAAIVSVVSERGSSAEEVRAAIARVPGVAHLTVEVRRGT
ncbi:MAG TPA: CDF family Co(II)/Ni(II) efflux transporter DmeF [Anaeromyxobacter sp.]|nr:CDF family Co(II)/Ni(II) efflux transporter DmeF [Anaeromyxobacter sp.]